MKRHAAVSRRRLLAACLASAPACLVWGREDTRWRGLSARNWSPRQLLDAVLPNLASARAIGEAYLDAGHADEKSAERLVWLIFGGHPSVVITGTEIRAFIGERLRRDFAAGAVVRLDGWMLSVTEARLCALAVATDARMDARAP